MKISLVKQNSAAVLESIDSYDHLIEQRAKTTNKKQIKKIDVKIEDIKNQIIKFCDKIKKEL